jgi:hypothetical protein
MTNAFIDFNFLFEVRGSTAQWQLAEEEFVSNRFIADPRQYDQYSADHDPKPDPRLAPMSAHAAAPT